MTTSDIISKVSTIKSLTGPHVPSAVIRFFRNNPSWEAISSPINCFGFRRIS